MAIYSDGNAQESEDYANGVGEYNSVQACSYPFVGGFSGGGRPVYFDYNITSVPTTMLIDPTGEIVEEDIFPLAYGKLDSVLALYPIGEEVSIDAKNTKNATVSKSKIVQQGRKLAITATMSGIAEITYYSLNGKVIQQQKIGEIPQGQISLNLPDQFAVPLIARLSINGKSVAVGKVNPSFK